MSSRRDCRCLRVKHQHGTPNAYIRDHCRCEPCAAANSRRQKINRHRIARIGPRTPATFTTPDGTARRLRALAAVGWSAEDLAPLLGTSAPNIIRWRLRQHGVVRASTVVRVAAVYDQVWNQQPPGRYPAKVRRLAAAAGWLPPAAWDDDTIDDPTARPAASKPDTELDEVAVERIMAGTLHVPHNSQSAERREAIRRLAARGFTDREIGDRVGIDKDAVCATRIRHHIPAGLVVAA